jgi:hypothetical protein
MPVTPVFSKYVDKKIEFIIFYWRGDMPVLLTKDEASDLFDHINHSKNPRKNMHTRDVERPNIKGQRKWNYLNGMKYSKNVIKGHVYYRNGAEISYQIKKDGTYVILHTRDIEPNRVDIRLKALKTIINKVVNRGHSEGKPVKINLTPNQYYLRRQSWGLTKTAQAAIESGDLSGRFLKQMAKWELCLIKGRPKNKS